MCLEIHASDRALDDKVYLLACASCFIETKHITDKRVAMEMQEANKKLQLKTQADIKACLNILSRIKGPADLKGEEFLNLLKMALE